MNAKQFTKFATGITSGLSTMQELRDNKSSLFETYPQLQEGDVWARLLKFGKENGLQPGCSHIRTPRTLQEVVNILLNRGYNNVGQLKYLRGLINLYLKEVTQEWNYKKLLNEWRKMVKTLADKDFETATRDYNYNNTLKAISNLVFNNAEFKGVIVASIGAGLLDINNPVKFVQNWYTYTDINGNLLVKVPYINDNADIIANVWTVRELKRNIAQSCFENALRNVKKAFKAGRTGRKYEPLKRYTIGDLTEEFYAVVINEKGRYCKGDAIEYSGKCSKEFKTTLVEFNKQQQ